MKQKILIVCGTTASGKTSFALKIARKLGNTSLISIDSRQSYQGLPILTGQDIPPDFVRHTTNKIKYNDLPAVYFSSSPTSGHKIRIWGVDQVPYTQVLNISTFTKFIWQIIKSETIKNRYLIIVGGTGLYLKAITNQMSNIHLGFDQSLRNKLNKFSLTELQKKLKLCNPQRLKNMNQSDRNNPRRLIRAIEIASVSKTTKTDYFDLQKNTDFRWIGLKVDDQTLKNNIRLRVLKRLNNQVVNEVKMLNKIQKNHQAPINSALGLKAITQYYRQEITKQDLIKTWTQADFSYAKRQRTWFKKQPSIIWYDEYKNDTHLVDELSLWLNNNGNNK